MRLILAAALVLAAPLTVQAQEATSTPNDGGVVFVNMLAPAEGVTVGDLAAELTDAMQTEMRLQPGFRAASVHIALDGAYVLNYAQWDNVESVMAVGQKVQAGELPETAQAFTMSTGEFHPYRVSSVTVAGQ